MPADQEQIERIIDKLVRDVETSVHALYRGDVRQQTQRVRTEVHRQAARDALGELVRLRGPLPPSPNGAGQNAGAQPTASLSDEETAALVRCVMAWLPMGPPNAASPESRCVAAGKELLPSWGERETARAAARRLGRGGSPAGGGVRG